MKNNTVAAISTPHGRGGIALIRISGDEAVTVADKVFYPSSGKKLSELPPRYSAYGRIIKDGEAIDDGIAVVFRAPNSYTGEDVAEITCHGGILLASSVLEAVFTAGAEPAGKGEFTKRAFLSGKLSLTEAEGIIDLIDAKSEEAIKLAKSHVDGVLSSKIDGLYGRMRDLLSQIYVYADYPDEDLTDVGPEEMKDILSGISGELEKLASSYDLGRAVSEGIPTVICGKPNTGKSSVLNLILGRDRAIVSDIPGTTRDTLEETFPLGKVMLKLTDTAGIRSSDDEIEKIGVGRAKKAIEEAGLILAVFDVSEGLGKEDREVIELISASDAAKIAVLNKADLVCGEEAIEKIKNELPAIFDAAAVTSALNGRGLNDLEEKVNGIFNAGKIDYSLTPVLSSARQLAAVKRSREAVMNALKALEDGFTPDVAGTDVEIAMAELGQTDGRAVSADIVDSIFHRFCVGK